MNKPFWNLIFFLIAGNTIKVSQESHDGFILSHFQAFNFSQPPLRDPYSRQPRHWLCDSVRRRGDCFLMGDGINREGSEDRGHSSILSRPLMCPMNAEQQGARERLDLLRFSKGLIPRRCCLDSRKEKENAMRKRRTDKARPLSGVHRCAAASRKCALFVDVTRWTECMLGTGNTERSLSTARYYKERICIEWMEVVCICFSERYHLSVCERRVGILQRRSSSVHRIEVLRKKNSHRALIQLV